MRKAQLENKNRPMHTDNKSIINSITTDNITNAVTVDMVHAMTSNENNENRFQDTINQTTIPINITPSILDQLKLRKRS